jgi:uncharacterized membrane protein YfcA
VGASAHAGARPVKHEREQVFALGMGLGMLLGVLVGSLVVARLPAAPEWLRRLVPHGGGRQDVDFAALLQ